MGGSLKNDLPRSKDHRRSFSQPPEDIARLMKGAREEASWGGKQKIFDGGDGVGGDDMELVVGNFKGEMRQMDMEGREEQAAAENVIERGVRKMSDAIEGLFDSNNKDKDKDNDIATLEETRDILGGEQTDDDLSVVGEEGFEDETDDEAGVEEIIKSKEEPLRQRTKSG